MRTAGGAWVVALVGAGVIAHTSGAAAQGLARSRDDATTMAVFGTNVLLGGVTAATRALIGRRDPARAFALGALGGAVHFSGKLVGPLSGFPGGIPAVVLGSTGTAIVSNAAHGLGIFDELLVPVGPLRVRYARSEPRKIRLAVNAYDAVDLARNLARAGMTLDWDESAASGTFAFVTRGTLIKLSNGDLAGGLQTGSSFIISSLSTDRRRTARHELVHVQQYWFLQEAIGRPVEAYLRARVPGGQYVPRWLELGIVPPVLGWTENVIFGRDGPVYRLAQSEAEMLESR